MIISGVQKLTLLDFPGRTACTVFFAGCNFRCPFCHNAILVERPQEAGSVLEDDFFDFLKMRKGLLDGVAITGGESDGYTYNVTDPVYIYPGSNRELTFTK